MTDHVRTQIRDAMATQLAGLATTGARVFKRRVRPLQLSDLPCLLIYAGDNEQRERVTIGFPAQLRCEMELVVEVVAKASEGSGGDTDLDALLDVSIKEVEAANTASASDFTLGGLVKEGLQLTGIETTDEAGEKLLGIARLKYLATYRIVENAPDVAI